MRALNTTDVFAFARIIKQSKMREDLKAYISLLTDTKDVESVGFDGLMIIMESLADKGMEKMLYEFLSAPWEVSPEDIAMMDLKTLGAKLKEMATVNDFHSFFEYVSGVVGKK